MPVMTKDVSEALTRGIRRHMVNGDDSGLTEREKALIAEGKSNKEIGEERISALKRLKPMSAIC